MVLFCRVWNLLLKSLHNLENRQLAKVVKCANQCCVICKSYINESIQKMCFKSRVSCKQSRPALSCWKAVNTVTVRTLTVCVICKSSCEHQTKSENLHNNNFVWWTVLVRSWKSFTRTVLKIILPAIYMYVFHTCGKVPVLRSLYWGKVTTAAQVAFHWCTVVWTIFSVYHLSQ